MRRSPVSYEKCFTVNKGDTVETKGSLVKIQGNEALIAREMTKGSEKLALRDANGIPAGIPRSLTLRIQLRNPEKSGLMGLQSFENGAGEVASSSSS
jgi:hypothetical protein